MAVMQSDPPEQRLPSEVQLAPGEISTGIWHVPSTHARPMDVSHSLELAHGDDSPERFVQTMFLQVSPLAQGIPGPQETPSPSGRTQA
jgi:hypothetical protein